MAHINPYLTLGGNCEEVFEFYKAAFGGEFVNKVRYKDAPSEHPTQPGDQEKIMHVSLPIGKGTYLMGSDKPESFGPAVVGNTFSISVNAESEEEATRLFNKLSAGGTVTMPLQKTFWGAYFGMFTDKFGLQWMINYEFEKPQ